MGGSWHQRRNGLRQNLPGEGKEEMTMKKMTLKYWKVAMEVEVCPDVAMLARNKGP